MAQEAQEARREMTAAVRKQISDIADRMLCFAVYRKTADKQTIRKWANELKACLKQAKD
jgi:hypothetical protein